MPPQVVGRHHHLGTQMPSGGVHPITAPLGPAECVVHLGRSYPREDPSCSGPVPTAKTTLNPAHVRPERRALHNEPRLDDPSCSGPVPTAKTTLNPAHVRPERRALHNEPRLDDTITPRQVLLRGLEDQLHRTPQRIAMGGQHL